MSALWFTTEFTYQQTYGLEFQTESSGYLQIEPVNGSANQSFSVPFLWWWIQPSSNLWFQWWDNYRIALGQPDNSWTNDLQLIQFNPAQTSNGEQSYFLILPQFNTNSNPFINFDNAKLTLNTSNPTADDSVFNLLLNSNYRLVRVESAELDIPDLLPQSAPVTVPESSSVVGVLILGVAFAGLLLKRKFFQAKKRDVAYS